MTEFDDFHKNLNENSEVFSKRKFSFGQFKSNQQTYISSQFIGQDNKEHVEKYYSEATNLKGVDGHTVTEKK